LTDELSKFIFEVSSFKISYTLTTMQSKMIRDKKDLYCIFI